MDCSLWLHQIKRALGKNKEVTEAPKKPKDARKSNGEETKNKLAVEQAPKQEDSGASQPILEQIITDAAK